MITLRLSTRQVHEGQRVTLGRPPALSFSDNGIRQRVGKGENATNGFHLHLCAEPQITPVTYAFRNRKAKTPRSGNHGLCMMATTLR